MVKITPNMVKIATNMVKIATNMLIIRMYRLNTHTLFIVKFTSSKGLKGYTVITGDRFQI